jgi:predicted GH43/DUF377 family glycosyl hydrolase
MISHASNPTVEHIENSLHRVYFGCRDAANRGSIASFDFDLADPSQVFNRSQAPIVSPGSIGTFDDSGISMGSIVRLEDGRRFLYYVGWNLGVTVPWRNSIGLAIAENGSDHFDRYSLAPILDRNQIDPYSLSYPWIVRVRPNEWLMYYGSNLNWGKTENDMKHVIKIASSRDGISWIRDGEIAIALASPEEIGISRPCVVKDDNLFKMWYSYRAGAYRIGYAESLDGHTWKRMDHYAGIDVSESGWDSASISYGCVFDYNGQRYMLYNGNDYGRTGIGLASLAE